MYWERPIDRSVVVAEPQRIVWTPRQVGDVPRKLALHLQGGRLFGGPAIRTTRCTRIVAATKA